LVEYRVSGAAVFFMANGDTLRYPLALPDEFTRIVEQIKDHLGGQGSKEWDDLVADVNSNLSAAISLWNEVRKALAVAARKAGLFAASAPLGEVADTYWPELFVASIWQEPAYYDEKKVHSWEKLDIVETEFTLNNSHSFDSFRAWIFADSNMIRGQSKKSVEDMKEAWQNEATRAEPSLRKLMAERVRIDEAARKFQVLLGNLESEYVRTSALSGVCSICKPWLDELNSSPISSSPEVLGGQTTPN
jgi:hypothetical protein